MNKKIMKFNSIILIREQIKKILKLLFLFS